jgi:hypothetical protein
MSSEKGTSGREALPMIGERSRCERMTLMFDARGRAGKGVLTEAQRHGEEGAAE